MKKLVSISLVLVLLLSLSVSAFAVQIPYFETRDFEEYKEFVQNETLSDKFVDYEDVSYFGIFKFFTMPERDKKVYAYSLEYYPGKRIHVSIYESDELVHKDPLINESKDLRTYWNTVSGTVVINGVGFRYFKGNLSSIRWSKDGCIFTMDTEDFHTYPHVEGDLISQLLMRDTAEDAIEVLLGRKEYVPPQPSTDTVTDTATDTATTDAIPSGGENASFPWLWLALPVGAVVIVGGVAFFLLRKKRTPKKSEKSYSGDK